MNKAYRLIWSDARNTWVVAHESAAARGKPASQAKRLASLIAAALLPTLAVAGAPAPTTLPTGEQVVAGQVTVTRNGSRMTIYQATNKAIVNWNSFNLGRNAAVTVNMPDSSAVALYRSLSSDPSAIYGSLRANGQVFLINPNGVVFGKGAHVNVQGLVASALNINDTDFMNGNYRFTRDGATGSVVNQGEITAKYVALLAPEVRNEGVITAKMGTVALAAGEAVTLDLTGQSLIDVQVEKASIDTLVRNNRLIRADGGTVILSAQSANDLVGSVVNSGQVAADGITSDGGVIRIRASSNIKNTGTIHADAAANGNGGSITAIADLNNPDSLTTVDGIWSAKGGKKSGNGGFIETSGSHLKIAHTARINTTAAHGSKGSWLLDPYDFTVAASGGDITGADLSTALGLSNVTIETTSSAANCTGATCGTGTSSGNGDIFINDAVSWDGSGVNGTTLTLSAWRNIEFNANVAMGSSDALSFSYGQSGSGGYKVGSGVSVTAAGSPYQITNQSDMFFNPMTGLAAGTTSSGFVSGSSSTLYGYIFLTNSTTTSVYGDSPTFTWAIYDSATSGGNLLSLTTTGTASWTDTGGLWNGAQSNVGSYSLLYNGGLSANGYTLMNATNAVTWTVTPKPLNVTVSKTADGSATFSSGFALSGSLVGSDSLPTVSGGSATVSSANAGTYNSFTSNSLTLSNSNYAASGTVSATINAASVATPTTTTTQQQQSTKVATAQQQQNLVASVVNQMPKTDPATQDTSTSPEAHFSQLTSGAAGGQAEGGAGSGSTTQALVQAACSQCDLTDSSKGSQLELNELGKIPTPDPNAVTSIQQTVQLSEAWAGASPQTPTVPTDGNTVLDPNAMVYGTGIGSSLPDIADLNIAGARADLDSNQTASLGSVTSLVGGVAANLTDMINKKPDLHGFTTAVQAKMDPNGPVAKTINSFDKIIDGVVEQSLDQEEMNNLATIAAKQDPATRTQLIAHYKEMAKEMGTVGSEIAELYTRVYGWVVRAVELGGRLSQ
jgi:filamentous hemagglutinin family protein